MCAAALAALVLGSPACSKSNRAPVAAAAADHDDDSPASRGDGDDGNRDADGGDGDGAADGDGGDGEGVLDGSDDGDPDGPMGGRDGIDPDPAETRAAAARLDPHAQDRREAASDFCALLTSHDCLSLPSLASVWDSRDEELAYCRRQLEVEQSTVYGEACYDEWRAALGCLTEAPWTCPCDGNDCMLRGVGTSPGPLGGVCDAEEAALARCRADTDEGGELTGSSGECNYYWNGVDGCYVQCYRDVGIFESDCDGPLGGAQTCSCLLNGVNLRDPANHNGWFPADSCVAAAQTIADGYCERSLSCCFTWQAVGGETCTCTADPGAGGFDSCQAAAAAGGGQVVDLCPQYRLPWGEFPAAN